MRKLKRWEELTDEEKRIFYDGALFGTAITGMIILVISLFHIIFG